jgi:hypothetical protein
MLASGTEKALELKTRFFRILKELTFLMILLSGFCTVHFLLRKRCGCFCQRCTCGVSSRVS